MSPLSPPHHPLTHYLSPIDISLPQHYYPHPPTSPPPYSLDFSSCSLSHSHSLLPSPLFQELLFIFPMRSRVVSIGWLGPLPFPPLPPLQSLSHSQCLLALEEEVPSVFPKALPSSCYSPDHLLA